MSADATTESTRGAGAWQELCRHIDELDTLASIAALLGWDQQVAMGSGAAEGRAMQQALVGALLHERGTSPQLGELLSTLEDGGDLDKTQQISVRNMRRSFDRSTKISADLATRSAKASAEGLASWTAAKEARDFSRYVPALKLNLELALERCRAIDPDRHPYDVILENYDPGVSIASLRATFARLRDGLTVLAKDIADRGPPSTSPLSDPFDVEVQRQLHLEVVRAVGYDETRGALAVAAHPFSVRVGATDVRIATRLPERDLLGGLAATLHETGHALYEQGLPRGPGGSTVFAACSTAIHESQARFWENMVGRSLPFYRWLQPTLARHFPSVTFDPEALCAASNRVVAGPIRISADEVTYNLHIILRFEIEVALFEGTLAPEDVGCVWQERSREYLGVEPRHDAEGVLQDAHWSAGAFGYFPSYALGNLYAASQYAALRAEAPEFETAIERGDFATILNFQRERIHRHGRTMEPTELMRTAVGDRDHVEDLLTYLRDRHG